MFTASIDFSADAFAVQVHSASTLEEGIHCNVLEVAIGVVKFYAVLI